MRFYKNNKKRKNAWQPWFEVKNDDMQVMCIYVVSETKSLMMWSIVCTFCFCLAAAAGPQHMLDAAAASAAATASPPKPCQQPRMTSLVVKLWSLTWNNKSLSVIPHCPLLCRWRLTTGQTVPDKLPPDDHQDRPTTIMDIMRLLTRKLKSQSLEEEEEGEEGTGSRGRRSLPEPNNDTMQVRMGTKNLWLSMLRCDWPVSSRLDGSEIHAACWGHVVVGPRLTDRSCLA